jgi:two-component system cell cycle sensor histidine kinase/response regulator CckA
MHLTVLIVEDEPNLAKVISLALQTKGYEVLLAGDGEAALRLLRERGETIDVLLTDVMLPHVTGLDLITLTQGQWPRIKIIICSGQLSPAELAHTGVVFLGKPFTMLQLYAALEQVLSSPTR